MKKGNKTGSKILAGILVITLLVTTMPEAFSRVASAAESAWKVVKSPTSVIEEIYCFDGENYAGGESGYKKSILADSDMNVVFQGSETRPLMISSDNDKGYYYGDFSQQSEKFSGFYEVEEKDTDGGTWRGVIDKKGREIIPMKKDMDDYNILIGTDGLIYFKNGKEFCYNVQGKEILSEKIVLQSNYIKEKFPNADSVEFDYYRYNGYVALFIQTGRRRDKIYFELKGNIMDYPVAKEIAWGHCNGKKTISEKIDYEKKITSCLENYLKNEEEKVVSILRAEGIAITDDWWDRDLEYFQMENKDDGENDENTYWVGCVQIRTASKDWMYYYNIFDEDGNCVANGREKDTLYCWPEENGQSAGYSYRQGDYFVGYDRMGEQIFKVPVRDENSDTNIINVRPVKVKGESYYQYWDKAVGRDIEESKQFGILDESGKIIWNATYGKETYKDRTMSRDALAYGKIVYEHTDVFDHEKWEYNYLDYNYVYDLKTGEFLGKYDDCVAVSNDSLCIAYTDGGGVGHATMYMKDGKEFEVTLNELTGAKQWSVKKIEGSDAYGFYGYKKASCGFPLKEKRGWAASPDTWECGWNLGGQCAVIVDAQGNKLQSAVADSVYVNETKMQIMALKSGDYAEPPAKPLRTPSSGSSEEETQPSKILPEITYTGFVNGIERTLILKPNGSYYKVYLKIGEEEPIWMGSWERDTGMDRYGTIWTIDDDDNTIYWYSYDLSAGVRHWYGIEAAYENTAALVFEGSGSQAIVTGYETFSGEIYPLLTFDEQKAIAAPESDISTPVYTPSQTPKPDAENPSGTVVPPSNGIVNPSASTAMPSVGTTPQTPSSVTPNQSSKISSPAKVSWKSAKNITGKKVALIYKKVTNAKGYQIMYATDKKFSKNKKSVFTSKTSYTAAKLKKGTTYHFKVRAYRLDGRKKVYGAWSGTKKIKIKK